MNILNYALRRIAVRKTEKVLIKTYQVIAQNGKRPKDFKPEIPSIGLVILNFFMMPIYVLGAGVIFTITGFISIYLSLTLVLIAIFIFIMTAIKTKSTFESKLVPVLIPDRRFKSGYREEGLVGVADTDSVIHYSKIQRIYFSVNMMFMSFSVLSGFSIAYYFIQEISKP